MAVAGELVEYMAEQLTGDIRRMESAVMNAFVISNKQKR